MRSSYLRLAGGVCVVATGLFLGSAGGGIAMADSDSRSSTADGTDGGEKSAQPGGPASGAIDGAMRSLSKAASNLSEGLRANRTADFRAGGARETLRDKIEGVTSTIGSGRIPGEQFSGDKKSSVIEPGSKDGEDATQIPSLVAAVPNLAGSSEETVESAAGLGGAVDESLAALPGLVEEAVGPVDESLGVVPEIAEGATGPVGALVPEVVEPTAGLGGRVDDLLASVREIFEPAAGLGGRVDESLDLVPEVVEPAAGLGGRVDESLGLVPEVVESVSDRPAAALDGSVGQLLDTVQQIVGPFPGIAGSVDEFLASVPEMVEPVSVLIEPIQVVLTAIAELSPYTTPVIAPIQQVLNTVAEVASAIVPAVPLRSGLTTLIGMAADGSSVAGLGGYNGAGVSASADGDVFSAPTPLAPANEPLALPRVQLPSAPSVAPAAEVVKLGGAVPTSVDAEPAPPAKMELASAGAVPMGVQSFLRQAVREIVRSPSLAALAAIALPGVGGLLILTAAGVRIGYRQAKAGLAMRTAGIARFAAPGPLGVVRSGSLIAVRPKTMGTIRPKASDRAGRRLRAVRLVDEAA